jgi:hypothetical protein
MGLADELVEDSVDAIGSAVQRFVTAGKPAQHRSEQVEPMNWAPVFRSGRRGSVSVSAGTAARTVTVSRAVAEIFAIAEI